MQCPKCQHDFEQVSYNSVEIDRCTHCYGIWFDQLEQDDLKKLEGAASLDIGDEFVGARNDTKTSIRCPHCNITMNHVVHEGSIDIRFERCPDCCGSYFDAGEFKDYLDEEIFLEFQEVLHELELIEPSIGKLEF